ncbi:hypothetical protein GOBAR_DD27533 [Gossypium barbadense]|nr:hypothetical protein GOBAR_DD27533 [Gossypium barbadense]
MKLTEMKRKISAKITIRCGMEMSILFYKFPISTDLLKFCEMQLLDDDDLSTMMEIWWLTGSENPQPVKLFAELANLKPVENDDIDNEGLEKVEDVHGPSFSNSSRGIILRNEPRGDMLNVYPDAAYASEFLEYADIVPAHRLASKSQLEELFIRQRFENKLDCVFAIKQYIMK